MAQSFFWWSISSIIPTTVLCFHSLKLNLSLSYIVRTPLLLQTPYSSEKNIFLHVSLLFAPFQHNFKCCFAVSFSFISDPYFDSRFIIFLIKVEQEYCCTLRAGEVGAKSSSTISRVGAPSGRAQSL